MTNNEIVIALIKSDKALWKRSKANALLIHRFAVQLSIYCFMVLCLAESAGRASDWNIYFVLVGLALFWFGFAWLAQRRGTHRAVRG